MEYDCKIQLRTMQLDIMAAFDKRNIEQLMSQTKLFFEVAHATPNNMTWHELKKAFCTGDRRTVDAMTHQCIGLSDIGCPYYLNMG